MGSRLVSHASTNTAQRCLTSLIGREAVFPPWYEPCMTIEVTFASMKALLICAKPLDAPTSFQICYRLHLLDSLGQVRVLLIHLWITSLCGRGVCG